MLHGRRAEKNGGLEFFELDAAVVVVGGLGQPAARRAAQAVVERYSPVRLVSAGIAGALKTGMKVGDVIRAREVVNSASAERFVAGGNAGTVVTVTSVSGPAEKRALATRWSADVVEMEAAAVAEVALANGLVFEAVKAVSDDLEFAMPPLARFVSATGKFETLQFAAFIALRPRWWRAVGQLNANSQAASVKLSEELLHLIWQRSETASEGKSLRV